jgi:cytochrome c biogenesis protein CcmG/thiol:disulfide interchange protein DsbE
MPCSSNTKRRWKPGLTSVSIVLLLGAVTAVSLATSGPLQQPARAGQPAEAERIVQRVAETFEQARTLRMKVHVTQREGVIRVSQDELRLDVLMTADGRVRVDARQAGKLIAQFVSDGRTAVEFDAQQHKWTRGPSSDTRLRLITDHAGQPRRVAVLGSYLQSWVDQERSRSFCDDLRRMFSDKVSPECELKDIDGRRRWIIRLSKGESREEARMEQRYELTIDADTALPLRLKEEIAAALNVAPRIPVHYEVSVFDYENVELNPPIPDDAFRFEPPAGATFVDASTLIRKEKPQPGDAAPQVTLADLAGHDVALTRLYADRPALVVFWATWCMPCKQELVDLEQLVADKKLAGRLNVVAVSVDQSTSVLETFLDKKKIPFTVLHDVGGARKNFGGEFVPATFLIDSRGIVRGRWDGWSAGLPAKDRLDEIYDMLEHVH